MPSNIKFINLSKTNFNLPLNNLPNELIAISLPEIYNQTLDYLPFGIKYIYINNFLNGNKAVNYNFING